MERTDVRQLILGSVLVRFVMGVAVIISISACGGSRAAVLTADMPLHLEDHLDAATVVGSELPKTIPATVEWRFDQPQPDWKATPLWNPPYGAPTLSRTADALRITLTDRVRISQPPGALAGVIHVDVPDWSRADWAEVVIRARADSASSVNTMRLGFNLREGRGAATPFSFPFLFTAARSPVVRDGTVQTYRLRVNVGAPAFRGPWRQLVLAFNSDGGEPGSIDLLSVSVVPIAALYAQDQAGLRSIDVAGVYRRSLFTHAPGRLEYRVRVPDGGRLQTALGVLGAHVPVEFRISARSAKGEATSLLNETYADPDHWAERSVDLSRFAGQTITLALEVHANTAGTVAFWGSPTLSRARRTDKPNVILYIIDGGWADDMSVYGYNRRTTPNLERLAAEGAVFEHAYSNSSHTKPSTASFMTSLHNSVLGNTSSNPVDPLPPDAMTMAERFHRAGYQTAVFTSNPNAGTVSGLQRGADVLRDSTDFTNEMTSSVKLHDGYWSWRENSPEPYWVHFQPTDVHAYQPTPVVPFSGLFVTTQRRREFFDDWARFNTHRGSARGGASGGFYSGGLEAAGLDRGAFFETMRGLYDESLAHQDYQIGRLVERLQERGEWEHTLLIVAADHAIEAALFDLGALMQPTVPPRWNEPMLRGSITRVPLIVVWPGHIKGGQRFNAAVSMIDVLPTVLDLTGLPKPDVMQGQSLAPLLRGEPGWTPRPVILDYFRADSATGALRGQLEVVDGRWGASMHIGPPPVDPARRRPWPLLLYDVWADPWALHPINEQRPDLVKKYTTFLDDTWKDHQALAKQFKPGPKVALTSEQLERLRSLGYIR